MLPVFAIVLSVLVFGESAFVDTLQKCSKSDDKCQKDLIDTVIHAIAKTGIPEYEIPPLDPMVLSNQSISILEVDLSFDGVLKGIKTCVVNKFHHDLEHRKVHLDITCDLLIKGKYKVFSKSQLIKNLLGGESVHGEGDGKIKIEKLNIKLTMPFEVKKRGNDIFLLGKRKKITYSFDVLGKVVFAANNLYLGDKESSADIMKFMNEQSSFLVQNFGKDLFGQAVDFIYEFTFKFFSKTPAKYFISDDLSSYVS